MATLLRLQNSPCDASPRPSTVRRQPVFMEHQCMYQDTCDVKRPAGPRIQFRYTDVHNHMQKEGTYEHPQLFHHGRSVVGTCVRLVLRNSTTIFRACMSPQGLRCYYGFLFVAMRRASCKHVGCRHTSDGCSDYFCTTPERPCTMQVTIAHHTYAWSEYQTRPPLRCVHMRLVRSDQQFLKSREQARAGLVI